MHRSALLVALATAVGAPAQSVVWSPGMFATAEGNTNNTIPFWSASATYQQIHDYGNMRTSLPGPLPFTGIAFRKDTESPVAILARSMDVQIVAATTTVASADADMTFAVNLGSNPATVLPWTPVNLPALTNVAVPNPAGWMVPWATPYVYALAPGMHFCWEWRHRNASSNVNAALDASTGGTGVNHPNEGLGCVAAGQSQPASILRTALSLNTGSYIAQLGRAAANAGAVFVFGVQRTSLRLPGMCAPLLCVPLLGLPGATDAAGDWTLQASGIDLRNVTRAEVLGQFAFLDASLGLGLGLSDLSVLELPPRPLVQVTRIFAAPSRGGAGYDLATSATGRTRAFGLMTGFVTP